MNEIKIMKKLFLFLLLCCFSLGYAKPLPPVVGELTRKTLSTAKRMSKLTKSTTSTLSNGHSSSWKQPSFWIQFKGKKENPGFSSAFLVRIRNKVYGVSTAHSLRAIAADPYMKYLTDAGEIRVAPITILKAGNSHGPWDIGVFEVPPEALEFIDVHSLAQDLPEVGDKVNIYGFSRGEALSILQENVLFNEGEQILIKKTTLPSLPGFCGAPGFKEGEKDVSFVYVGSSSAERFPHEEWFGALPSEIQKGLPSFYRAVPAHAIQMLVEEMEAPKGKWVGRPIKVFGKTVIELTSNEYIFSVSLIRNGSFVKTLHAHPFMNIEALEQVFDLQENDELYITIHKGASTTERARDVSYRINTTTGKVTSVTQAD